MKFKIGDKVVVTNPNSNLFSFAWKDQEGVVIGFLSQVAAFVLVKFVSTELWSLGFAENELELVVDNEIKKDYFMEALI